MVLEYPRDEGMAICRGIGEGGGFADGVSWSFDVDKCNRIQMDNPIAKVGDVGEADRGETEIDRTASSGMLY